MRGRGAILGLAAAIAPAPAFAHRLTDQPGWQGPEPWMLICALLALGVYGLGFARLRRLSTGGRDDVDRRGALFAAAWLTLAGATLSPLHQLGGHSFTAHMLEHELIMLVAAPLFILSRPLGALMWAFPTPARKGLAGVGRSDTALGLWRTLTDPRLATVLQVAALWLWHLPSLFDRALRAESWHAAQHLSFFVTALLFWSAMLGVRRNPWTSAACLFATSMATGALGAFMALSQSPWYGPYAALGLAAFGLTPAEDQELAGALMWVPGGLFHAVVAIALVAPRLRGGLMEARDA